MEIPVEILLAAFSVIFSLLIVFLLVVMGKLLTSGSITSYDIIVLSEKVSRLACKGDRAKVASSILYC